MKAGVVFVAVVSAAFTSAVSATVPAVHPPITGVSHIAVYAADLAKSERFYVHDLGGVKGDDPESDNGVRYYFAPTQFVEVLPLPAGRASINRLDHVAFTTTDAKGLRAYLASKQIPVPAPLQNGRDGSQWERVGASGNASKAWSGAQSETRGGSMWKWAAILEPELATQRRDWSILESKRTQQRSDR